MVDAPPTPLPPHWPAGQQGQGQPPPQAQHPSALQPQPSGRKRERQEPAPATRSRGGHLTIATGGHAHGHSRQESASSSLLAAGLCDLDIGGAHLSMPAAASDQDEGEDEAEAAILTGQAIKRLRIESSTSTSSSAFEPPPLGPGLGPYMPSGPFQQQQGQGPPPSPPPPQPSSQPFAPPRLGRPDSNSSSSRGSGFTGAAGAPDWQAATAARQGIAGPPLASTSPATPLAAPYGPGQGTVTEAAAAASGGVQPTSLFAVARARSSGSTATAAPSSVAGSEEAGPSPCPLRSHGRSVGSAGSGGGLTRSLSDPCLHSPTAAAAAATAAAATAAAAAAAGAGGHASCAMGLNGGGATTPTTGPFFRGGASYGPAAGEGGDVTRCGSNGRGGLALGGPSPGVSQDDADVDYSLINNMLGRLHFDRVHRGGGGGRDPQPSPAASLAPLGADVGSGRQRHQLANNEGE